MTTPHLTPREAELYRLLLTADSQKEIAHKMGVSLGSVHRMTYGLCKHFGVSCRVGLMAAEIERLRQ